MIELQVLVDSRFHVPALGDLVDTSNIGVKIEILIDTFGILA
jgi:hypothetical protein